MSLIHLSMALSNSKAFSLPPSYPAPSLKFKEASWRWFLEKVSFCK